MKTENLEMLVERWVSDSMFRDAVRNNLEQAVAGSGVTLSDDEWEAVRGVDWSAGDEELAATFNNIMI